MKTMIEPLTITQVDDTERPTFGKFQVVEAAGTGHAYVVAELWYRHASREQYVEAQRNANKIAALPDLLGAAHGMDLDCLCDVLNPCTLSNEPGKHWGAGDACSNCKMKAAVAKAEER
jgi:hypothetical protein